VETGNNHESEQSTASAPLLHSAQTGTEAGASAHAPLPLRESDWRPAGENFKSVPESKEQREAIRLKAAEVAARMPRSRPPDKQMLMAAAEEVLTASRQEAGGGRQGRTDAASGGQKDGETGGRGDGGTNGGRQDAGGARRDAAVQTAGTEASATVKEYDRTYLGFAMVMLNNEYWREEFAAVPFGKRLLLLPQCLKQPEKCPAKLDETQLHCKECGLCALSDLSALGQRMGYQVLIAEGTPVVLKLIASGAVDGILGVACLNVLEKAFDRVLQVGVPALAIPLLRDSCHNTAVDEDWVLSALGYQHTGARRTRSFVPLLRSVSHWFDPRNLAELLPAERSHLPRSDKVAETERLALAWLRKGGKRFRPFVTAAAWQALTDQDDVPRPVQRVAAAMEVFHKASLIHDDIEDDDELRYGMRTLHRTHSVPVALNTGDYLVGLGYRIIAEQLPALGAEKTARILQKISAAHVKLAEGQGAELLWRQGHDKRLPPLECLRLYALKTAPAFEAALVAGVTMGDGSAGLRAGEQTWDAELAAFAKHLGVAYQIQNDLQDIAAGQSDAAASTDIAKGRPTLLFALALEAASAAEQAELLQAAREGERTTVPPERVREIYFRHEIPVQAMALGQQQRQRALQAVEGIKNEGLHALFTFLAATLLD
jgi:geranylgeranyl pyrophosphate synthase